MENKERHCLYAYCKAIFHSSYHLLLPSTTGNIAIYYLHKWWRNVDAKSSVDPCACAALLLLACKSTENLRSIKDIIAVVTQSLFPSQKVSDRERRCKHYVESVIKQEHKILRLLGFEMDTELPHNYMLNVARHLKLSPSEVHIAWMMLNDVSVNSKVVSTRPELIAIAVIFIALDIHKRDMQCHNPMDIIAISTENANNSIENSRNLNNDYAGIKPHDYCSIPGICVTNDSSWWCNLGVATTLLSEVLEWMIPHLYETHQLFSSVEVPVHVRES